MQPIRIRLSEKKKKLFLNVISIIFIFNILYAVLAFFVLYQFSIFKFTASQDFITAIVIGVLSYIAFEIIQGKKKEKKTMRKTNRKPSKNKKLQQKTNIIKHNSNTPKGTSTCPQCGHLMIGVYCRRCNITWDKDELKN